MEGASLVTERQIVAAVGTGMIVLGAAALLGGIANLALAPARPAGGDTPGFPLDQLPPWVAIAYLVTQNWLIFVVFQIAFGTVAVGTGIGFRRWRSWARGCVEELGWAGTMFLAAPVFWVVRSILRSPSDRALGL